MGGRRVRLRIGPAGPLSVVALFFLIFFPFYTVQWMACSILLLVALSYLYTRVIGAGLSVERAPMDLTTYRFQSATVSIRVANRSILPVPHLVIGDNPGTLYTGYENVRLLSLKPGERRSLSYRIKGMNRGSYRIGPISVTYTDPLGFFPVSAVIHEEIRLIVYPTILPVHVPMDAGLPAGTITAASRIYEDPTRYRSVREYIPGDEMRRINWKVTARTGRLHSTEWLPTINFPVMILLNLTAADYERSQRYLHMERTIDAAASLVHHLAECGQSVGLASTGLLEAEDRRVMPWIPTAGGSERAVSVLQTLAQLQPNDLAEGSDAVSFFLDHGSVPFGTRVFYLGPPLAPDRVVALLTSVGARSLVRLHYTDERVTNWATLAVESVRLWRITEFGDDVFIPQA
jgi:uncharacterized protein (DUF58 family)